MAVYLSARGAGELGDIDKANRNLGLKKPFSAVPMQRLLVQIVDRYCKRPDFLDTELTWHREREGLTHTVVIHKHLFDEARTDLLATKVQSLLLSPGDHQHIFVSDIADVPRIENPSRREFLFLRTRLSIDQH